MEKSTLVGIIYEGNPNDWKIKKVKKESSNNIFRQGIYYYFSDL
jgi:hypothetical protein